MRLLLLCPALLAAAELPVVQVTVLPDALVVERAGPGSERIDGLPLGLDERSLAVEIDGRAAAWRLERPEPAVPMVLDPARLAGLQAAERAEAQARLRADLARCARGPAGDPADAAVPPLPTPDQIRAQVAFAGANAGRAQDEVQAAAERLDAARAALATPPPPALGGPVLVIEGAVGRPVRLRYRLPGASWQPAWRLEVAGTDATLVQLADITVPAVDAQPLAALAVATRSGADAALLRDPEVPVLGLPEAIEIGSRRGVHGGSKASEGTVDLVQRNIFSRRQEADGSWEGRMGSTAGVLLCFLGAGYDHKTPNRYKPYVARGLAWIVTQPSAGLDLPELVLATMAVAEAYAMTSDPDLRPRADALLADLRRRWPDELAAWQARPGPLAGPETAAWTAMALKSAHAGGLEVGDDLVRLQRWDCGGGEEGRLAGLVVGIFTGLKPQVTPDEVRCWLAAFDRWWAEGRTELVQLAVLAAFQSGGVVWELTSSGLRDRLIGMQLRDGADAGMWPTPHPLGQLYGSTQCALALEVYYRYAVVRQRTHAEPTPAPPPIAFPIRLAAPQPVRLTGGRQQVELRRASLPGAIGLVAVPARSPGVWRRLEAANPWPGPLPGGALAVVADGRMVGTAMLEPLAAGKDLALDLGPDDRLRVHRTVRSASDDGLLSRELTVTASCRLEAPAGFAGAVTVRESLPRPAGDEVRIRLLQPLELGDADYRRRLADEPVTSVRLSAAAPEAVLYEMRLDYPRSVRPRLETR